MRYFQDDYGYKALFDEETGISIRHNDEIDGFSWKKSGPELLDISITNYCERGCDFCYRSSNKHGSFMSLEVYRRIIMEAKRVGVFQIALGGGNPNQHPCFIDILKITKENNIIPSYTTNGQGITEEILQATKECVGTIAVSWYNPYKDAINLINRCYFNNIPINIHFVLDNDNLSEAKELLSNEIIDKINAVIFLNYKPVGDKKRNTLSNKDELEVFLEGLLNYKRCKIGFDSCMISHLSFLKDRIKPESVDYCEAARYSAFISEKGYMYPCSFMCGSKMRGSSILKFSLIDIWKNSKEFNMMRQKISTKREGCDKCDSYDFCHGGCPCFPINCKE